MSTKSATKTEKTNYKTEGGKTTATTTTTYGTDGYGSSGSEYRSSIGPRSSYVRQSLNSPMARGGQSLRLVTEMSSSSFANTLASPSLSSNAANSIVESREREKKEMVDLNDRLASYIEKVRFLEAQNRKLGVDLEALRSRWGKDTGNIKQMFEGELNEARKLIDVTASDKSGVEKDVGRMTKELADYKKRYDEAARARDGDREKLEGLMAQLSDAEAEIGLLRRRIAYLEEEVARLKKENMRLVTELQKARSDLDQETLNRIDYQNQVQTLLEEVEFLRRVHDQEIKELQALAARDTTAENREFFKNELASAIRDIRRDYDAIQGTTKTDMESWYKLKVQEIQTQSARQNMESGYQKEETKRLRSQLGDQRGKLGDLESRNAMLEKQLAELTYQLEDDQRGYEAALNDRDAQIRKMREEVQALMVELQMLLDTKQTLDAEIAIYRKMLEGEEERGGLRQLVEQVVKTHSLQQHDDTETTRVVKGEQSTRSSFQRSAKGNVSIAECSPEGKYILLENTHRSKIWARGQGGMNAPPEQLIFDGENSWGTGSNVETILYNKDGDERATHIQRLTSQHTRS